MPRKGQKSSDTQREAARLVGLANKGRKHSEETKKAIGEAGKGRVFSDESKAKMSAASKGKPKSEEHRANINKFGTGTDNVFYTHGRSEEHQRKINEALTGRVGHIQTEETRAKIGSKMRQNWLDGTITQKSGKWKAGVRDDLGFFLRSTWEANYARILNYLGLEWSYEPKRFSTPYGSYAPDFYLPSTNEYVEVKGWEFGTLQKTKRDWLIENESLRLRMIDGNVYWLLAMKYAPMLDNWESNGN